MLQPLAGRLRDQGRPDTRAGCTGGLLLTAAGLGVLAALPGPVTLFVAAAAVGGILGTVTPLAIAHLAACTPDDRTGRTMGNAELGREVGDAGGPLLVGAVAITWSLPAAIAVAAVATAAVGATGWRGGGRCARSPPMRRSQRGPTPTWRGRRPAPDATRERPGGSLRARHAPPVRLGRTG
ncbi:MFS transporter [Curtobacterium sp. SGAir0471]|uniref:MFS transporter n=1 Tax=Curtobacterium sp. SGAir0471 TaxID=2070337 RepID=UPI0020C7E30F|nr:MFS transporter [Curtobacterium sp. SGAir0471]